MKFLLAALALAVGASSAHADDLSDAANALDKKNYPVAVAAYTRLADAGNAEAAFRLGELYWYGEGVPLDRAKGDALFARAAASGNQGAAAALKLSAERQAHLKDIAWWTSGYFGAELFAGKFKCVAPTYPVYSESKRDINAVSDSYANYINCYNGFVDNLSAAMLAGKQIPEAVAILMSEEELATARAHLGRVYADIAARGKAAADQALAQNAAWTKSTEAFLTAQKLRSDTYMIEMERQRVSNANAINMGRVGGGNGLR